MTSAEQFAQRIAAKVYFQELAASRALGYPGVDAYTNAFRIMDQTYEFVLAPARPATLTRFRPMRTK